MRSKSEQRAQILRSIKKRVLAHHINVFGVDYDAWCRCVDKRTPDLTAADEAGFEAGVQQLLAELQTSHTAFYHTIPKETLPQHTINASLRDLSPDGCPKWMFLDIFEAGPASLAGIMPGDILEAVDGITCVPPVMPQFGFGQTHKLVVRRPTTSAARDVLVKVPQRKGTKQRPPIVEPKSPIL